MDRTAIEAMMELSASVLDDLEATNIPSVIIPKNNEIKSLEHLLDNPHHFKTHFSTHILSEFTAYATKNKGDGSVIYIDQDHMKGTAIFDHGNPKHPAWGHHKASLELVKSPAYDGLWLHHDRPRTQQDMIDFFSDWRMHIEFYNHERESIEFNSAINRIRRLTVTKKDVNEAEQRHFNASRTAMESVELNSGSQPLPAFFTFTCQPYDEFEQIEFFCEMRGIATEKDVQVKYRIESVNATIEKIVNEFRDKIKQELTDMTIYIGSVAFRER